MLSAALPLAKNFPSGEYDKQFIDAVCPVNVFESVTVGVCPLQANVVTQKIMAIISLIYFILSFALMF